MAIGSRLFAAARGRALLDRRFGGFWMIGGELNIDADDLFGVSICQTAEEGTEQLPFATGLARTYHLAIDHAIVNRPIHPTWIEDVLVLDAPAALGCFEGAQLAGTHGIDECLMKMDSRPFNNLKPDHTQHLLLQKLLPGTGWATFISHHYTGSDGKWRDYSEGKSS
jgi:hypothetical protein